MSKKRCAYCGNPTVLDMPCRGCGALELERPQEGPVWVKSAPFFYNGYMIWPERAPALRMTRTHFWRGTKHIETIETTDLTLEQHVSDWEDPMPFVWKLFCASQDGTTELVEGKDWNGKKAVFEIRRLEPEEAEHRYAY